MAENTPGTLVERVAKLAADLRADHTHWREGQAAFNALNRIDPTIADKIRGSAAFDPFHVDDRLPDFWQWLAGHQSTASAEGQANAAQS